MRTIEDYIKLSIKDLKRLGFLKPNAVSNGYLRFSIGGRVCAEVGAATDTRGVPVLKLAYSYQGEPRDVDIKLIWAPSNLCSSTPYGYYYFVCPKTQTFCRNLYVVNGEFVSRRAFSAIYEKQTYSRQRRQDPLNKLLNILVEVDRIQQAKHRRERYCGKLTPWGRHVVKIYDKYRQYSLCLPR